MLGENKRAVTTDTQAHTRVRARRRIGRIVATTLAAALTVGVVGVGTYVAHLGGTVASNVTVLAHDDVFPGEDMRPAMSSASSDDETDDAVTAGSTNILLLGSDTRGSIDSLDDAGGNRADTIMVVNIPADGQSVTVMSIMRDNWVAIPGHGDAKINAALAFGGVPLMVQTIEGFIDDRIDHVAIVDFEGFRALTDALGGVTVDNPVAFRGSHKGKYAFAQGEIELDGAMALSYVRERYAFPDGDYQRVRNQQAFLSGVLQQLGDGAAVDPVRVLRLAEAVSPHIAVDDGLSMAALVDLAMRLRGGGTSIRFFTSPTLGTGWVGDQSIVRVDWDEVEALRAAFAEDTLDDYAADR